MFHLIYKVIRISRVMVGRRGRNIVNLLLKQTTLVYRKEGIRNVRKFGNFPRKREIEFVRKQKTWKLSL